MKLYINSNIFLRTDDGLQNWIETLNRLGYKYDVDSEKRQITITKLPEKDKR